MYSTSRIKNESLKKLIAINSSQKLTNDIKICKQNLIEILYKQPNLPKLIIP